MFNEFIRGVLIKALRKANAMANVIVNKKREETAQQGMNNYWVGNKQVKASGKKIGISVLMAFVDWGFWICGSLAFGRLYLNWVRH